MSEPFVFDPRCTLCKFPFGAAECGASVFFHVRPLKSEGFTHCALVLYAEFCGHREEHELTAFGVENDRFRFDLTLKAPSAPELVWYHFRFWRDDGSGCYLDQRGYGSSGPPQDWQLTVYHRKASVPHWFGEGVTYQIFPDRFCRLRTPSPAGMIGNRRVHENWSDSPDWRPDADGEIRNRDFFGGSLNGICSKLDRLESLSVTTLYLNPIFESASNHRYNTADYRKIDPMLGTEADFQRLCREAGWRGIHILLDGVFNHTGSQSRYFNADGYYPTAGAAQSRESPWYPWYHFTHWPDHYDSWWGIRTLPALVKENPDYIQFLADAPDSVIRHWLRSGADGWRLDVADELPDELIQRIRSVMEEEKPGSFLLGEVWEDGSNKISYSRRRRYLLGDETHGLMNYPFRTAALNWLRGGDAGDFREAMETLREHYPTPAFYSAMNFLGTHDTPRILTLLGTRTVPETREERAVCRLTPEEYRTGRALLKTAAVLLYAFPGSPSLFYGDEAGMQGFEDPFNRGPYPWGREDPELLDWYIRLGRLRREHACLRRGEIRYCWAQGPGLAFERCGENETILCALNVSFSPLTISVPSSKSSLRDLLSGAVFSVQSDRLSLTIPSVSGFLLI
jgi:4-alpha-glucanotransferase